VFLEHPVLMIFPIAMAFAGAMDLLTMTIPNRISLALIAGFIIAVPWTGMPLEMALQHMAAGGIVLAFSLALFSMGWFGGGDAKLLSAAALWIGMDHLVMYLAQVSVLGGALAIVVILYRRMPPLPIQLPDWAVRLHKPNTGIPYGIAIAAAGLVMFPDSVWFTALGS
jgi:prepilin peptidase CpaA